VIDTAREEFYSAIDSSRSVSADASGLSVKDKLMTLAWDAYYTKDDSQLEAYLKANGLYDKCREIMGAYDIEAQTKIMNQPSGVTAGDNRSVSTSFFNCTTLLNGDFFLCYGSGSSSSSSLIGFFIPGHWKHAGQLDRYSAYANAPILSASDQTTHGFAVGYETTTKWAGESAVMAMRASGRTDTKAVAANNYGKQFLGRGYALSGRNDNATWYCSKLIWRSWLSQGIDLEPAPFFLDSFVTPQDLFDDTDSYYVAGDTY
jgi:hypothetical protein